MQDTDRQTIQRPAETVASEELRFLGIRVQPFDIPGLNNLIAQTVDRQERRIIANHNLHSLYLFHQDRKVSAFYERADYIHVDGMPLVFLARMLGFPLRREHRVTYVDWISPLMVEAAARGWRVFYLGASADVLERGMQILRHRFPGLQINGVHGYFDFRPTSEENQEVLAAIDAYRPQVLLVGMGMPRQEHWILDNIERLSANVILQAGATIAYIAGAIPTPPRWSGQVGLEWLFRLLSEPRRLWHRYLIEPSFILRIFLRDFYRTWLVRT